MKLEVGKRYRSGDKEGRVIAVDRNHRTHTVVFLTDEGHTCCYTKEGFYNETPGEFDLQEIPKTMWLNVYNGLAFPFSSRAEADESDQKMTTVRLACVEAKEGDGL